MKQYEIAVDVGGTFTDLVLQQSGKRAELFKTLTTPDELSAGILNGISQIAASLKLTNRELLEQCRAFSCGTTAATNAILEGKTAKTVLLCTEGFRDTLTIREGGRKNGYNLKEEFPAPYVPRELTFGIRERVNSEGGVEIALDEAQVKSVIKKVKRVSPEALAVSLLWSVANPDHELKVKALFEDAFPDLPLSLSHQVNAAVGEYRRTSATCIDASLKPVLRTQISNLEMMLKEEGFRGMPTFICSNGGRTSSYEITKKPVYLSLSGPSTAPEAALHLAREAGIGDGNIITVDLGGTSIDACIVHKNSVAMHREGSIAGHSFGVPSVDIATVGAGGGSIAYVDKGGMLHVGPESAGSFPGPACYGRGGTLPTLTDANLVRGLLNADTFANGQIKLSREKSIAAIEEHVATPLGISVEKAATLIAMVAEQNMVSAIEDLAMRRGHDPREFTLVSGGAAGGLHSASIAKELGLKRVLVPRVSSVLCAYGTATGPVKFDFTRSFFTSGKNFDLRRVNNVLNSLKEDGLAFLNRMDIPAKEHTLVFSAEARYQGQVSLLSVKLNGESLKDASAVEALVRAFHVQHQNQYEVCAPDDTVEFVAWSVEALGNQRHSDIDSAYLQSEKDAEVFETVMGYIDLTGKPIELNCYRTSHINTGDLISGPALVQDSLTTILVPAESKAIVTPEGGVLITL